MSHKYLISATELIQISARTPTTHTLNSNSQGMARFQLPLLISMPSTLVGRRTVHRYSIYPLPISIFFALNRWHMVCEHNLRSAGYGLLCPSLAHPTIPRHRRRERRRINRGGAEARALGRYQSYLACAEERDARGKESGEACWACEVAHGWAGR